MRRFRNILFVTETGEASESALERAVTLAENNGAALTVVNVIDGAPSDIVSPAESTVVADLQNAQTRVHTKGLETLVGPYRDRLDIRTAVLKGVPFLEIIREVLRNGRDLVIKAPETLDWLDRFLGSADMHLLRKCPCPVWLIKPAPPKSRQPILAAVDVNDSYPAAELESRQALNQQVLEMAGSLALSDGVEFHIVSAWDAIGESVMRGAFAHSQEGEVFDYLDHVRRRHAANLDALVSAVTGRPGEGFPARRKPTTHLVRGWARKEIPALAKQIGAGLVVMGTVARTGIPGLIMGNTAETILNQLDCSVLAVKPPGFSTPVTLDD